MLIGIPALLQAQNEDDALRYSQNFSSGTTRASSMAGAFGALGGDFSSLSINPAGIGVYRSTEFTITPTYIFSSSSSDFIGTNSQDEHDKFIINNIGFISTVQTGESEGMVSISFGVGYNRLNNYFNNTMITGRQPSVSTPVSPLKPNIGSRSSSMLDNFTNVANDEYDDLSWNDNYEGLAESVYLLPFDENTNEFWNDINEFGYGQYQERWISESGYLGEYAFSLGANFSNMFYFGATFGIHGLRYRKTIDHYEEDDQENTGFIEGEDFISFNFREYIDTYGKGYTFKMGMIYKPINMLRLGAAFHIPTFYRNREEFYTAAESLYYIENEGPVTAGERNDAFFSKYTVRTPYKAIGSAAIQIPNIGIISLDYEFVDYTFARLEDKDGPFHGANQAIKDKLKKASNIKSGAEVHLGPVYLRGGFAYFGSPYSSSEINHDSYTLLYTGGLGVRSESFFLDFGYARRNNSYTHFMYREEDYGVSIANNQSSFMATLGFRF